MWRLCQLFKLVFWYPCRHEGCRRYEATSFDVLD